MNNHRLALMYHGNWQGGTYKDKGYIFEHNPDHPRANKGGYVFQHRLIMERYLGRYLDSGEVAHHIDGNPSNNGIENLELCLAGKHTSYHMKLKYKHKKPQPIGPMVIRKHFLKAFGCEDYRKCQYCKEYDSPDNLFISSINRSAYHRKCKDEYERRRREVNDYQPSSTGAG